MIDSKRLLVCLPSKTRTKKQLEKERDLASRAAHSVIGEHVFVLEGEACEETANACDIIYFAKGWKNDKNLVDLNDYVHKQSTKVFRIIEEV